MVGDEVVSDSSCKAFGPKKWKSLYSKADSLLEEASVTLAPFGGLTANAVAHLRSDWIEWGDEFVMIRVPAKAACNSWMLCGGHGRIPSIAERDEPCSYCRRHGTTEAFENLWKSTDGSEGRAYTATLHRDIAEPAIEFLDEVFHNCGRDGIYATPGSVAQAANRLLCGESRDSYSKLLRTGVTLYCHYGLDITDIADLMPYTESTVENILNVTPEVTYKINNSYTYLRAVAKNEPVSVEEVAQELGVTADTVRRALKRLKERNRVKVDKSERQHKWSIVGDWTKPFLCDVCSYISPTLHGISVHKAKTHDE